MDKPVEQKASRLVREIEQRYRTVERKRMISRMLIPVAVFILGVALFIWIEQQAYFSSTVKIIIGCLLAAAGTLVSLWKMKGRPFASLSEFYATLSDGIQQPSLKHALDLSLNSRDRHLRLYDSALQKNLESISWDTIKTKLDQQIHALPSSKFFRQATGGVGLALVFLILSAFVHPDAFVRTARFWNDYEKPNPYSFTVAPGNTTIEQGGTFQPSVAFDGSMPDELLLGIKTDVEKQFRFRPLHRTAGDTFRAEPVQLSTNTTYFVKMGAFDSKQYKVNVQLRPRFESLTVEVFPPVYTGLDSTSYRYPFSQVKAYQGSEVKIRGRSNKSINGLKMISSQREDTTSADQQNGNLFTFNRSVATDDTLRFSMRDSSGLTNNNDFAFSVDAVEDEYPFAELLDPTENVKMNTPSPLDLTYRASDDFGLTSASLHYELQRAFVNKPETGTIKLGTPSPNTEQHYSWDVPSLNPKPRDVITFWIEVSDNDRYNGYKNSQSRKLAITLPSLVENMEDINKQESDVQESLENVSDSFEEMKQEYDRFKENLKRNPETNYEQKQMLKEVQDKQEEIDKKVDELNNKFEEIRKQINQNDMVSDDTRRAYEELQKLMKEINDPELKEALEELQKAMGSLNQQQLRKALENYEFNEQEYQERLKRTIELFKTLKMNSDLEQMATALDDLAKKEEELSKSEDSHSEKADQQEAIREDTDKLSDQMEKLDEKAPENARKKIQELQQEGNQELDSVRQELQKNIEQLRQQNAQNQGSPNQKQIQQQQQQIQQQYQQLSQKMRNAKQQFSQQRMQINLAALQNILYNLVNLSEQQEDLTQNTEQLATRSQAFVQKARIQKNITRQFSQVSDSLFAVSAQIPGFSNAINTTKQEVQQNLQQAVDQLAERNKSQSTTAERQSLGGINELSSMVASLIDRLQNQQQNGMGGGMSMQQFMKQLQKMSGSQQQLNQQIQKLINDIQGDRLTRDQIDRLNQMAKEQNRIRKQLRQLQENGELDSGDKTLSELQRMAEEMERTINDLRGGKTDGELVKRQQNILSRMLNAEKAMQERGKNDKRKGTTAEETPRTVPPDMTLEELQKKMRNLLNDPNQTPFSEDYQRLIEQYFELLKQYQKEHEPTR